jgi:GT2 family glycosyltransferase
MPSPPHPELSILIAVSSRTDLLAECLTSLDRHVPKDLPYETIVVLNEIASTDAMALASRYPDVRFLPSPVNLGMAGSANRARREASGRFLVTLHDDATVEPGWAEALLQAARLHPRAGAIGSKVLSTNGSLQNAGSLLWRSGSTSPPWFRPAPAPEAVVACRAVDYCGTCSLLIPAAVFDAVGGFDETIYPAYYVDVDFGLAIRAAGYYVLCEPRSVVRHHRHASSGTTLRAIAFARNRDYLMRKWATAIAAHQPQPLPGQVALVEAALRRAREFAAACEAGSAATVPPDVRRAPCIESGDEDDIERHYRLSRTFYEAIITHLEAAVESRDHTLSRMPLIRLSKAVRRVRRTLATAFRRLLGRRD